MKLTFNFSIETIILAFDKFNVVLIDLVQWLVRDKV